MLLLLIAVVSALLFTLADTKYTVWSSVIFSRTGERTPSILDIGNTPIQLTSLGARQQYDAGSFFRKRYLESFGTKDGLNGGPIAGLSKNTPDVKQLYVEALDMQTTVASAQAFMQGFYPPFQLTTNDTDIQHILDPTSVLANGTYAISPLNGYQYAQIHAPGAYDPEFVFLGANIDCLGWYSAIEDYFLTPQFAATQAESSAVYEAIGPEFLSGVLSQKEWSYVNAYAIYDYLSYLNEHNVSISSSLSNPKYINPGTNISYLDSLRWYADQQQFAQLGSLDAANNVTGISFPSNIAGSISTISGNFLAAKMLAQLQVNVAKKGEYYKLSVLFGDYQPLVSFFSLMGLPHYNSDFYGLPNYGSAAVLELFSDSDSSDGTTYPSEDDLWVRFWFNNGTNYDNWKAYPLFNLGPEFVDMPWGQFQEAMNELMIGDVGVWCQQCGGDDVFPTDRVFCSYWNSTDSLFIDFESSSHDRVSPTVAGVIGAIVTLVVAGIIFGLIMLIGGVRLYRNKGHKSDLGGFKGSQKLASDKDLTLPKGGAVVGATVETPGSPLPGGHERVGSWELKQHDMPNIAASHPAARRPSFEDDDIGDIGAAPFRKPTEPDERV